MRKSSPDEAQPAPLAEATAEAKSVRLYRKQDQFHAPPMTRSEADEILAGYPGEYIELPDEVASAPATEADAPSL